MTGWAVKGTTVERVRASWRTLKIGRLWLRLPGGFDCSDTCILSVAVRVGGRTLAFSVHWKAQS